MKRAVLDALVKARSAGVPAILVTQLSGGDQALMLPDEQIGDFAPDAETQRQARHLLAADRSEVLDSKHGRIFVHVFNTLPRLIVVGAVHVAEPLARMAQSAGYSVVLIDPRRAFAAREQFRGFTVIDDWPDEALVRLKPDERSAVVTLTHDPKLDDPALLTSLRSPAFYIGCLGSRKTQQARLNRLRAAGVAEDQLARIHGPVGLSIGAQTPAEIAISILAEITRIRRETEAA
jgi:xanthine dehydrogenase accessory factor